MHSDEERELRLTYEYAPCEDCQRNVNAAFDILFDAVLKRQQPPVENLARANRQES